MLQGIYEHPVGFLIEADQLQVGPDARVDDGAAERHDEHRHVDAEQRPGRACETFEQV
jgi:hypothetical protein